MSNSPTIVYFGQSTVEQAITNWFHKNGINEVTRDGLIDMVSTNEDDFFQMVCDYIEKNG